MIDELLDETQVRKLLGGISRPTLYRGIKQDRYPRPVKVGVGRNRWPLSSFRSHWLNKLFKKTDELKALLPPRNEDWIPDETIARIQQLDRDIHDIEVMLKYFDGCVPPPPALTGNRNDIQREVRKLLEGARRGRRRILGEPLQ